MTTRRTFVKNASALAMLPLLNPHSLFAAAPLLDKIGLQLFSIPKLLDSDFRAALSLLADIGFKEIEMYGPYPFTGEESRKGWESLEPQLGFKGSGFFGKTVSQIKSTMKEFGFTVPSLHTDLDTLDTSMGALADAAHSLGSAYVVLPSIPAGRRKSIDDYKKMAVLFNKIGADAQMNGIRFAYHNHGYGFHPVDGQLPIDIIFNETDRNAVFLELDLYWTTAGGADPAELMKKHAGRYKLVHIKDMKQQVRFKGDGGDPSQWIELFPYMSSAGDGVLDLPNLLKTAKDTGVEHFIVEQDMVAQPEVALKRSFDYLKSLEG